MSYHDNDEWVCIACATTRPPYYLEGESKICLECGEWDNIYPVTALCDFAHAYLTEHELLVNNDEEEDLL